MMTDPVETQDTATNIVALEQYREKRTGDDASWRFKVAEIALTDDRLPVGARALVSLIALRYVNSGSETAWPSQPTLQACLGVSCVKTVRRHIQAAVKVGYLEIVSKGVGRDATVYRLRMIPVGEASEKLKTRLKKARGDAVERRSDKLKTAKLSHAKWTEMSPLGGAPVSPLRGQPCPPQHRSRTSEGTSEDDDSGSMYQIGLDKGDDVVRGTRVNIPHHVKARIETVLREWGTVIFPLAARCKQICEMAEAENWTADQVDVFIMDAASKLRGRQ
ncbi:helix-turn-helix domain-containing protein [Ahrensia sp. R2A130]|uniref:helix-turn-helix domain-containing protein n=1 Tax=Ahrensia sp. R2A130 TaxID=744979 RepID=UPI0001E0BCBD|nr:helix-turn-helix domain-containing protein [Ahrensia sp. R2A130]EFL88325.1 hypothetical protein R2A130_3492 [Ahrensia sp. R2A130]